MYELTAYYEGQDDVETMITESEATFAVENGFLFCNCGQGQSLTLGLDTLTRVKLKYPLPPVLPVFKYKININYNTPSNDVELLFSSKQIYVKVKGDSKGQVVFVMDGDDPARIINSKCVKSIKVTSYTEGDN